MLQPGITIVCPSEASGAESVPAQVRTTADMRTYWDNNGIIDKALTVALLRRDQPGLRVLPNIDPRAIMLPDTPLIGRPSDAELDADSATVTEDKVLDARAWEEGRRGAAEYFVTGAFSKWWSGVRELRITDPHKRVARWDVPRRGRDGRPWKVRPLAASDQESSIRFENAGDGGCIVVPVQAGVFAGPHWLPSGTQHPWISVVGFHLCTRGGACGGDFAVDVAHPELAGEVLIPLHSLSSSKVAGDWLFLGVAGGQLVPPAEVHLRPDDAG